MEFWLLVRTKTRQERRALEHLSRQGVVVFLPEVKLQKLTRNSTVECYEALFPGYLFVGWNEESGMNFNALRSTRGVLDVVRFGSEMAKVPCELVSALRDRCVSSQHQLAEQLSNVPRKGDRVVITEGPFKGLDAVFVEPDGNARACLLITLLQQQVTTIQAYAHFQRAV